MYNSKKKKEKKEKTFKKTIVQEKNASNFHSWVDL